MCDVGRIRGAVEYDRERPGALRDDQHRVEPDAVAHRDHHLAADILELAPGRAPSERGCRAIGRPARRSAGDVATGLNGRLDRRLGDERRSDGRQCERDEVPQPHAAPLVRAPCHGTRGLANRRNLIPFSGIAAVQTYRSRNERSILSSIPRRESPRATTAPLMAMSPSRSTGRRRRWCCSSSSRPSPGTGSRTTRGS